MSKSIDEAYREFLRKFPKDEDFLTRDQLEAIVRWLKAVYPSGRLLERRETVALAKKILSRGLQGNWTRAEVEAFLRG